MPLYPPFYRCASRTPAGDFTNAMALLRIDHDKDVNTMIQQRVLSPLLH